MWTVVGEVWSWSWRDFWPQFVATLGGVLIGVPLALFVDRRGRRWSQRQAQEEESKLLAQALRVLRGALEGNQRQLQGLHEHLERKASIPLWSKIDIVSWDAVRGDILSRLGDLELAANLARHFAGIRQLVRGHDRLVAASMNPDLARAVSHPSLEPSLTSARTGDPEHPGPVAHLALLEMREEIRSQSSQLSKEAGQLAMGVGEYLSRLRPSAS